MRYVHDTSKIHCTARIGAGCVIGPRVEIGPGVVIGAYSCIGGMPEHRDFYDDLSGERTKGVVIEEGVRIYEFVTIHSGTQHPTWVKKRAAIFQRTHLAHDCVIEERATIGGQVSLAGHTVVMEQAIVSGKACTHQFCVIGAYAIISAASYLRSHVGPGEKWIGNPSRSAGLNDIGLARGGMTHADCLAKYGERYAALTRGRNL